MKIPNLIYSYLEPRFGHEKFGQVRYVGSDQQSGKRTINFKTHDHGDVGPWIEELKSEGFIPKIQILEMTNLIGDAVIMLETGWTEFYRSLGQSDLNWPNVWPPSMKGRKNPNGAAASMGNTHGRANKGKKNPRLALFMLGNTRGHAGKGKKKPGIAAKMLGNTNGKGGKGKKKPAVAITMRGNKNALGTHNFGVAEAHRGSKNKQSILTETLVKEIKDLCRNSPFPYKEIARIYGVSRTTIYKIKSGKQWTHVIT